MSKRLNIGVYIGPNDLDIAAWFNMLRENKIPRARWVKGLLAAYALDKPLNIGTISFSSMSVIEKISKDDSSFGWQVKGPNGEFVRGSIINICMGKSDVVPILEESWVNNRQLATFVKALIRKNLKVGDKEILPNPAHHKKLYSEFLVKENSKPLVVKKLEQTSTAVSTPFPADTSPVIPVTEPSKAAPVPASTPTKPSTPAFDFGAKQETRTKNPLSNYI